MMRRLLAVLLFVLCAGLASPAHAQSCSASPSGVAFGSVSPIALTAVNGTGTINITCTWPAATLTPTVLVCLNLTGSSPRAMTNGTNQLTYDLYTDSGRTVKWGSALAGGTPLSVTLTKPSGTTQTASVTIFGQIGANQPTVPSVNSSNTAYSETVPAGNTSLNYSFYLLIAPTCASLATSNGTFSFTNTATVINNCTITTTNMGFTASGVLKSALSASSSITTRCTNGDSWRIALNGGSSGNVAARQMQRVGGGGAVNYQLYSDSSFTTAWGDGTGGTSMVTGTGTGNQQVISVFGRVPAQTTPQPGSYSDTITATITF
jgi:spore coat protein U-like protein